MSGLISLFIIVLLSLLVTRVATVALTLTGLSRDTAKFQARSALTGVGFTTSESEQVVQHPVRRRILMLLMLLGNAGAVSVIASLILSFVDVGGVNEGLARIFFLALGMGALWFIAASDWIEERMSRMIEWALRSWTNLEGRDYAALLHLTQDYSVKELHVRQDDWLADKNLAELNLGDEGVIVLGILRQDGSYVGAPTGASEVCPGDVLILYGREKLLQELDERKSDAAGEEAHYKAVAEQQEILRDQAKQEESSAAARQSSERVHPDGVGQG